MPKNELAHLTHGSVLRDLGLDSQDALELEMKACLHQAILKIIRAKRLTPRQLEKLLDVPQPRVSELMRGKMSVLSISKLLYYASKLGTKAEIRLKRRAA